MTSGTGLLDTSAVLLRGRVVDAGVLPEIGCISAVTLAELSAGPLLTDDPDERALGSEEEVGAPASGDGDDSAKE